VHSLRQSDVCVIGAGPYGLSVAAHLQSAGTDFRIFGSPMRRWLSQMPKSMLLKSEGCASSLADPEGRFSLGHYCLKEGLSYSDYAKPISREVFASYALAFQRKLVPQTEDVRVTEVSRADGGFQLRLSSDETLRSRNIIVATGLDHMAQSPEELACLPSELWSHSSDYSDLSAFKGKSIAVIGGGQSGLETAAILGEEGAAPNLIVRAPALAWNPIPSAERRSAYERLRRPRTRLGRGLKLWVYDNCPLLFHYLPREIRHSIVATTLGPAGTYWLKDRIYGQVPIYLGHEIHAVEARGGRVSLRIIGHNEQIKELIVDHVIASTGYRFDLRLLPFFGESIKSQLHHENQIPKLSAHFESSVQGLYFTGLASAASFGPLMRFIAGTGYTASRIATQIAKKQGLPAPRFATPGKCEERKYFDEKAVA